MNEDTGREFAATGYVCLRTPIGRCWHSQLVSRDDGSLSGCFGWSSTDATEMLVCTVPSQSTLRSRAVSVVLEELVTGRWVPRSRSRVCWDEARTEIDCESARMQNAIACTVRLECMLQPDESCCQIKLGYAQFLTALSGTVKRQNHN